MPTDTSFGEVRVFEDFLATTVTDIPHISVLAPGGGSAAIVAGAADGRVSIVGVGGEAEIGAVTFGELNWTAGDGY